MRPALLCGRSAVAGAERLGGLPTHARIVQLEGQAGLVLVPRLSLPGTCCSSRPALPKTHRARALLRAWPPPPASSRKCSLSSRGHSIRSKPCAASPRVVQCEPPPTHARTPGAVRYWTAAQLTFSPNRIYLATCVRILRIHLTQGRKIREKNTKETPFVWGNINSPCVTVAVTWAVLTPDQIKTPSSRRNPRGRMDIHPNTMHLTSCLPWPKF